MGNALLKFGLFGLGIAGVLIGGSIATFGSHAVVSAFNAALSLVHDGGPITEFASPNVDSELRFYGVMFVFYGAIVIQTARCLDHYAGRVPILLGVFFLTGAARALSYAMTGPPHALFVVLMAVELLLPIVLFALWKMRETAGG